MGRVSYTIQIAASPQHVWQILADFGGVYKFNPGVSHSHTTSAQNEGIGTGRHCDLLPSGAVEERIVSWEEGKRYGLTIEGGTSAPPFKTNIAYLSVKPNGKGTIAAVDFEYTMKYGPLGALMDLFMVRRFLGKAMQGLLAGLKHYAETGQEVTTARGLAFVAMPA